MKNWGTRLRSQWRAVSACPQEPPPPRRAESWADYVDILRRTHAQPPELGPVGPPHLRRYRASNPSSSL